MTAFTRYSCNSAAILLLPVARSSWDWYGNNLNLTRAIRGAATVRWLPWEQTDILREMLKALLLCVCQLGDRTGSSACRKWKICHIVSKLCSGRAPFLLLLPSPLCSLVWSCVDFSPESVTTRRCWAWKHTQKKNVFDFTGRPINSVDSRGCNFQSISLEKQHVKMGKWQERAQTLLNYQSESIDLY